MTINGIAVTIGEQDTIEGVIGAINERAGDTGATAVKNNQTVVNDTAFTGLTGGDGTTTLTLNGVTITLTTGNAYDDASFVARVNDFSNQTGVVASPDHRQHITFTRARRRYLHAETSTEAAPSVTASRDLRAPLTRVYASVDLMRRLWSELPHRKQRSVKRPPAPTWKIESTTRASDGQRRQQRDRNHRLCARNWRVRGDIGAVQNRFISAIGSLQVASENLSAARSRILDADVAQETAELTRNQILIQAGVAVLAQANQLPAVALSLLGR
jgi:flagellin